LDYKIDPNDPAQPKITAGMSCRVTIKLGRSGETNNEIVVPLAAVFEGETDNQPSVWIIDRDNLTVTKRHVTLGDFVGKDHIIIKSGLKAGEQIVAAGSKRLIEGQKVKILNQKNFN
jgi:multidrug efflux pump subunit AcrA (membrane-fusion protein)